MGSSQATADPFRLPPSDRDATESLASDVARSMAAAWREGERLSVEQVLVRRPDLAATPKAVLRLISEELLLRREAGERVEMHDLLSRFPAWRAELELLLACHDLFEEAAAPDFPQAGDECGEFLLRREIGRGAQGRVFLANQPALCDRPVVVKLTALDIAEHLSLARLQHTGIVPLYLAQDLPERHLRLLCMPFVGGASLAAIAAAMSSVRLAERSGQTVTDALARCHQETTQAGPVGGPAFDFLRQATYEQAICWIGACLAEALHFAHQHGLVHFDIKPSNLLLAGDGQPMLLDFHLARGPIAAGGPSPDWLGGTHGYMPPEQTAALAALREGNPIETSLDARADVYALAMVLDEFLTGGGNATERGVDRRRINPRLRRGLADILAKCLAPRPQERYADAQSLADDLRRHLADLPLRGVPNRSPLELWRKWRRRRPRSATRLAAGLVGVTALCVGGWLWTADRVRESQQALLDGQRLLDRQVYHEAIARLEHGLDGLSATPGAGALKHALRDGLQQARRAALGAELHRFIERLRFADGGAALDAQAAQAAARSCADFWRQRDRLPQLAGSTSPEAARLRGDVLDLVVFWLDLQARSPGDRLTPATAAELLDQAETLLGGSVAIARERSLRVAGRPRAAIVADSTDRADERYVLARSLLRAGEEARALDEFRRAVREEPQNFWANFHHGRCAYRLARYEEALNAFSICVALAPRQAECYYNRGLALTSLGRKPDALLDYDRALQLDPTLSAAAANRDALRRQDNEPAGSGAPSGRRGVP